MYYSDDAGDSWNSSQVSIGRITTPIVINDEICCLNASSHTIFRSHDSGVTWESLFYGLATEFHSVFNKMLIVNYGEMGFPRTLYVSNDGRVISFSQTLPYGINKFTEYKDYIIGVTYNSLCFRADQKTMQWKDLGLRTDLRVIDIAVFNDMLLLGTLEGLYSFPLNNAVHGFEAYQ